MKELHMIGNAHLDPVWLWDWREGCYENMSTLYSAIQRLEEFDDVIFTSSSAQFYEWLEEQSPEMFHKIQKMVIEGRWVICGGWWVQPDCNLPDGESYARHALISQNYMKRHFGQISKVGYNVDSFGHNGNMPALLRRSGMDAYVFMRPGPHEKSLPGRNFMWEANDGSKVAAFRIPFTYCTFEGLREHIEACKDEFDPYSEHCMCFYGVGNHGGGPTVENINIIHQMQQEDDKVKLVFDDPKGYFEATKEEQESWPVVHGELQHHASGCYSVVSKMKEWNRRTEHELLRAEKFCVMDSKILKGIYPKEELKRGWKNLLFNQFHDILAGSSIERAYEDVWCQLGESRSIASRSENRALQRLAFNIDIPFEEKMIPVTVFNPHSFPVKQVVEYETGFFSNDSFTENLKVVDSDERKRRYQFIQPEAKIPNRTRIAFLAEIPALGYETYRIMPDSDVNEKDSITQEDAVLENEKVRIVFDEKTGAISSYYWKEMGKEFMSAPGAEWIVCRDDSDTWGHDVLKFDRVAGKLKLEKMFIEEVGDVRETLVVQSRYQNSTVEQRFILEKHTNKLQVKCKVDWREKETCLKVCFPLKLEKCQWTCQAPFGVAERENNGEEQPMLCFGDITGTDEENGQRAGMTFYSDSKCSGDLNENSYSMTVLRSPAYVHHAPYKLKEENRVQYVDQGMQAFMYQLRPHAGEWKKAEAVKEALKIQEPAVLLLQSCHCGRLSQRYEGFVCGCDHIVMSSLKRAEEREGYIVRLYETEGIPVKADIKIPLLKVEKTIEFGGFDIVTLYIDDRTLEIKKVNFLEWDEHE